MAVLIWFLLLISPIFEGIIIELFKITCEGVSEVSPTFKT